MKVLSDRSMDIRQFSIISGLGPTRARELGQTSATSSERCAHGWLDAERGVCLVRRGGIIATVTCLFIVLNTIRGVG